MLKYALKEWAVICRALVEGKQALLLRKGGIAEASGEFQVEQARFWLYPTYVHQQASGIKQGALPLLQEALDQRPAAGTLRLSHFAIVKGIYQLHDMVGALLLAPLHVWTDDVIESRFTYRSPGLHALLVRVYQAPRPLEIVEQVAYAGCRSWVELDEELPTEGATPVLSDEQFERVQRKLHELLNPITLA